MNEMVGGSVKWSFDAETEKFDSKLSASKGKVAEFGTTASDSGKKAQKSFASTAKSALALIGTAAIIQKVKAFTVNAITAFGEFESGMGLLQAVTGATNLQMKALSDRAIALGADITLPGISAADAAAAMTELGKAGLDVGDILSATRGVLQSAKAGNIDFATSAKLVSSALLAFKLSGNDAIKVADLFASAANATNAEVEDVGIALSQMSAQAVNLKIPLGDTVALIAELANQGIRGSDAGTSLRTFLQRLIPQTKEAADAMKDLGIDMFNSSGEFIGIRGAIIQLQKGLKGLTQEQQQSALQTIFGTDAIRAASILTREGATGFDKMTKAVNRQGAAAEVAAARNKGIKGSLDALKSSFETIQLNIGKFLSKALKPLIDIISKNLEPVLIGLGTSLLTLLGILTYLNIQLFITAAPFIAIIVAIGFLAGGIAFLQKKFNIFGKAISGVKSALGFLGDMLGGAWDWLKKIGGIAADIAKGALSWLQDRFQNIKDIIESVVDWIKKHQDGLKTIAETITVLVLPALVKLGIESIKTAAKMIISGAASGAGFIIGAAKAILAWSIAGVKMTISAIRAAPAMILSGIQSGLGFIASAATTLARWAITFAAMIAGAIRTAAVMTASAIRAGIAWLIALGPVTLIITAIGLAALFVIKNWDKVKVWFGKLGGFLGSALRSVKDIIFAPFKAAFNLIAKAWNNTIGKIKFTLPKWVPLLGDKGFAMPKIPELAKGAIVTQPTVAILGEAGAEAVIPLKKLEKLTGSSEKVVINIEMSGIMARSRSELRDIAKDLVEAINEELRAKGQAQIGVGA